MILRDLGNGSYIETADGNASIEDLMKICPELRLALLEKGELESDPIKRKKEIAKVKAEIRAKKIRYIKSLVSKH